MSADIIAKIQVIPEPGQESEIAGRELRDFRRENFEQLAQLINMAVDVFKQELERTPQDDKALLELERVNL
ncbi:MAG: hypothetical protein KJ043_10220, partial [Anaerolineae bacterium]|nr:hypothetical protein [Anaerolineae bacterium]